MYSKLFNIFIFLGLMVILSLQTDEFGNMLALGYKGLLLYIAVCAIAALFNAVLLAWHISSECADDCHNEYDYN